MSIKARGLIEVLTNEIRATVFCDPEGHPNAGGSPVKTVFSHFWHGDVSWSPDSARDLGFWCRVDFAELSVPISSDTVSTFLKSTYLLNCETVDDQSISFLASDASTVACGGGSLRLSRSGFMFGKSGLFVSDLPPTLRGASRSLREITAILWMLESL